MKQGFSLLELLIGIAIFSIIAASVYTSLFLGIKVSKQEENRDEIMQAAGLTLKEISKRLRCSFISAQNEQIKFIGTGEQLDFFSINGDGDLENLIFYLEPGSEEKSFLLYQSRKKYTQLDEETLAQVELINKNVRALKFSYFNGSEKKWYEDWPEELVLPQQVKLEISFCKTKDEEKYIHLEKYVNIPVANEIDLVKYEEL